MSNDYISVSDKKSFGTIAEVCNELFATDYKNSPSMGWFKPDTFKGKLDDYKVWFPKLKPNEAGWVNQLVNNGEGIISKNDSEKGKAEVGQKNITFTNTGDKYIFAGIFILEQIDKDGTEHWKRIDDKCPIIKKEGKQLAAMLILSLLFLAMIAVSPSYAKDFSKCETLSNCDKSNVRECLEDEGHKRPNDFTAANYEEDTKEYHRVIDDVHKKCNANKEAGKKNEATAKEAKDDELSKELEKILPSGIKNDIKAFSSLLESEDSAEKEMEKIRKDPNMTSAKKQKQIEALQSKINNQKPEKQKILDRLKKSNAPITLKGINVYDYGSGRGENAGKKYIFFKDGKLEGYLHNLGIYEGKRVNAEIAVTDKFAEEADRGIYDITGTITGIGFNKTSGSWTLSVQLKSAKEAK